MNLVAFETILMGCADLLGLRRDEISTIDFRSIRQLLDKRLKTAWEFNAWPDLMRTEKRYYRALYVAGTTYSAPTLTTVSEVYFPATQKYYQALGAVPLAVTSITRAGTTATVTLTAASRLTTGDQVTITGATQTDYNVTATVTVTDTTHFTYTVANAPATPATGTPVCTPDPANSGGTTATAYWQESLNLYPVTNWLSTETNGKGDIRYWAATDRSYAYIALTSSSGNQPTDTTRWAVLTEFDRYIARAQTGYTTIGEVHWVGSAGPKYSTRSREYNSFISENGIQVLTPSAFAWLIYKIEPPTLSGDRFDVAVAYTAGQQVYYSSDTVAGNMYDVLSTTTAGDSPESAPSAFSLVQIPLIFQRFLETGAYSDFLRSDGQEDKAGVQGMFADDLLASQKQLLDGPQAQLKRTLVLTRT